MPGVHRREARTAARVEELEGQLAKVKLSVGKMAELAGFPSRYTSRLDVELTEALTSEGAVAAVPSHVNKDGCALVPLATVAVKVKRLTKRDSRGNR